MNSLKNFKNYSLNILKNNWVVIILVIIILMIFGGYFIDKTRTIIKVKKYEKTLKNTQKQLKTIKKEKNDLEKILEGKPITKTILKKIPCKDKDEIIIKQDSIIKQQENVINNLNNDLIDCNKFLKSKKHFGFSIYTMGGISGIDKYLETNKINIDVMIGVNLHHYFLNDRISFDYGLYVKPYNSVGFGGLIGFTIRL